MNYIFDKSNSDLCQRVCKINHIDYQQLDVSNFEPDNNIPVVQELINNILCLKDKRFLIVGDYDCDGICATTIIKKLLDDLHISNNYYIPSRIKEGYGLNDAIVDKAINNHFDVLFLLDNGVSKNAQIKKAHDAGIKTFIIDHHEYLEQPACDYLLHSNMLPEPYRDLSAGGLCCLLSNSIAYDELSIVLGGLATLADMVSVLGYNRYLIKKMKSILETNDIEPIRNLLNGNSPSFYNLSFQVIPKINAISRLDEYLNINYVVRYLLSIGNIGIEYYKKIEEINAFRKKLTEESVAIAENQMKLLGDVLVVSSSKFKEGLCGLIANRLMYKYNKPVIVFSIIDRTFKGSGRALSGSNLYDYLKSISEGFSSYGGHAQAIGLSLSEDYYPIFCDYLKNQQFNYEEVSKDALLLDQEKIDHKLYEELQALQPFGTDFPEPYLAIQNPNIISKYLIQGKYLKLKLSDKLTAVSFNQGTNINSFTYLIGKLQEERYHPEHCQIIIEDLV